MGLKSYSLKRLVQCILTILLLLTINFYLFRMMPGDPVKLMFRDPRMSPEVIEKLHVRFGLDRPVHEQFLIYLRNTFLGELGVSFAYTRSVGALVAERLLNTLLLTGTAAFLAILLGLLFGTVAAWKSGGKIDFFTTGFSLLMWSVPTFLLGMVLITILNPFFPVAGMQTPGASFNMLESIIDILWHMIVPLLVVTLTLFGQYVLVLRSSMKNVLVEDFILTARAKGLRELRVIKDHAIKNAILPFITLATISMGWVVAGSLQTEIIFSWPGIGRLVWDALLYRDYPLLQGCFLVLAISTILASFFADILYAFLDPRIRYGE